MDSCDRNPPAKPNLHPRRQAVSCNKYALREWGHPRQFIRLVDYERNLDVIKNLALNREGGNQTTMGMQDSAIAPSGL